jgi:hypothetical protein
MNESKLTWSSKRSRNVAQTVLEIACSILKERNKDIEMMYDKPGGWELWFQGELYVAMKKNMEIIPLSETKVYGNTQKCDFCFLTADGQEIVIELKCEGWQNKDKFVGEVGKDLLKLQNFQGPGYAIQIAISCTTTDDVPIKGVAKIGKFTLHWNKAEA